MKALFRCTVVVALCALLGVPSAMARQLEITLGHVGEPGSLFARSSEEFAERANAKLGDRARVVVYGSSQLGGDSELLRKLRLGTVDLALPSTVMSSVDPLFALFEMPYLVKDREHMARIREEIIRPIIAPASEGHGYPILGVWENGFRHITNNRRPIRTPEDLRGIKLRVPQGVWRVKMFRSYGAAPTPMGFSEVFVALQTGVMDGQENPLAQIYPARMHEVQKHLSLSNHVYTPAYLIAGRSLARMPQEVRQILQETAIEMEPRVAEIAAELDDELLQRLREAGIEINEVDVDAFVTASAQIYAEFAAEVPDGQALIEQAQALR
jgi:TRAP-type transport system periplasmic protein